MLHATSPTLLRPSSRVGLQRVLSRPCTASAAASSTAPAEFWNARRLKRTVDDMFEVTKRSGVCTERSLLEKGLTTLEELVPGLQVDLEAMKASDWAALVLDCNSVAQKLVTLKGHFPRADLAHMLQIRPCILTRDIATLNKDALQVKHLLAAAKDIDTLVTELPILLEPRILISCLVTIEKWYYNKRDPVDVLENDPDLVRRAEACDMPWEPVYVNDNGSWMAPSLNYKEKRTEWQAYIDKKIYKQNDEDGGRI